MFSPADVSMGSQRNWWSQAEWTSELNLLHVIRSREIRAKQIRASAVRVRQKVVRMMTVKEYVEQMVNPLPFDIKCPMHSQPAVKSIRAITNGEKTSTPVTFHAPPGFNITHTSNCAYCCFRAAIASLIEGLDISGLIVRYRIESPEECEKTLILKQFFLDNMNVCLQKNNPYDLIIKQVCNEKLNYVSPGMLKEVVQKFLKAVGFAGIVLHNNTPSRESLHIWAQEVCNNDVLMNEVVSACNAFSSNKRRMEYVNTFKLQTMDRNQ